MEPNGFEAPDELQIFTMTQQPTKQNPQKPKPNRHQCKKPGHYRNQCRQLKREKDQTRNNTNSADNNNNKNSGRTNCNSNKKAPTLTTQAIQIFKKTEDLDLSTHLVRPVVKQTSEMLPWSKCSEQTASREQTTGRTKPSPKKKCLEQLRWEHSSCSPIFKPKKPRLHSGTACNRPERIEIPKLTPISEVVWQQPSERSTNQCNLNITNNDLTKYYTQETSKTTVASQTPPPKGTQTQNYVITIEQLPRNQTGNEPVPFLNCSKNCPTDIQN